MAIINGTESSTGPHGNAPRTPRRGPTHRGRPGAQAGTPATPSAPAEVRGHVTRRPPAHRFPPNTDTRRLRSHATATLAPGAVRARRGPCGVAGKLGEPRGRPSRPGGRKPPHGTGRPRGRSGWRPRRRLVASLARLVFSLRGLCPPALCVQDPAPLKRQSSLFFQTPPRQRPQHPPLLS